MPLFELKWEKRRGRCAKGGRPSDQIFVVSFDLPSGMSFFHQAENPRTHATGMYASLRKQNNGMEGKGFENPPVPDAGGQRRDHLPHIDMPGVNRAIFEHAIFHRGNLTIDMP